MNLKNFHAKVKISFYAICIGLLTGSVSVLFNQILMMGGDFIASIYKNPLAIFLIPSAVALITTLVRKYLVQNQGFGVSQVMYEIDNIKSLVMKPMDVTLKLLATLLNLVAGFSVGRQGPIVHLGGAIGSNFAYMNKLEDDDTRVLIGCGVAGCLAGVFNAPIFATLFVVEILFKKRYFDMISTILLSALTSTILVRVFRDRHFFDVFIDDYHYALRETPYFLLLGLIMSGFAILYVVSLRKTKSFFDTLRIPTSLKALIGAIAIAFSLYFLKDFYFYNMKPATIFSHDYSRIHLYLIAFLYIFLTAVSIGSGSIGGIFAPGLFIGLTSGFAIAHTFEHYGLAIGDHKTYALAGMAAIYAGFATAPLSSTLMIVELTGQYNLIFPILIATLTASTFSEIFIHESIYHKGLRDLNLMKKESL